MQQLNVPMLRDLRALVPAWLCGFLWPSDSPWPSESGRLPDSPWLVDSPHVPDSLWLVHRPWVPDCLGLLVALQVSVCARWFFASQVFIALWLVFCLGVCGSAPLCRPDGICWPAVESWMEVGNSPGVAGEPTGTVFSPAFTEIAYNLFMYSNITTTPTLCFYPRSWFPLPWGLPITRVLGASWFVGQTPCGHMCISFCSWYHDTVKYQNVPFSLMVGT